MKQEPQEPNKSITVEVDPLEAPEQLLARKGRFLLRDIWLILDPESTGKYKLSFKQIKRIRDQGSSPQEVLGFVKVGGRVTVLMELFAPWYRSNLIFHAMKLDRQLTFEKFLLLKTGYFRLSEVSKIYQDFLPFSYLVLKRNADRDDLSVKEMGLLKADTTYLVVMPAFAQWLKRALDYPHPEA